MAEVIERSHEDIERRWLALVREDLRARGREEVDTTELRDGIGDYLLGLAEVLRTGSGSILNGTRAWAKVAREHAVTRVRLGFDIDQLVHEFITLRRVLGEVLRERGLMSDAQHAEEMVELLEAAIAAAVRSYVESRDYAARRTQAQHIGFVTHELRTPLNAAILRTERLATQMGPLLDEQQRELEALQRNHTRMRELIDRVLDAQRIEGAEVVSRPTDTTVGEILDSLLPPIRDAAEKKGLQLELHFDPALQLRVDPALTGSAIANLLDNAVKYTDEGKVSLNIEDRGDQLLVHVRDNCVGLSPEELKTIFEPFRRGRSLQPGTGLGLSIARRTIEAQGGQLHGESPGADGGCHFWFELPKQPR